MVHHLNSSGIKSLFHGYREYCWQRVFISWHHLWLLPDWNKHTCPRSHLLFALVSIQYLISLANWCLNSENIDSYVSFIMPRTFIWDSHWYYIAFNFLPKHLFLPTYKISSLQTSGMIISISSSSSQNTKLTVIGTAKANTGITF